MQHNDRTPRTRQGREDAAATIEIARDVTLRIEHSKSGTPRWHVEIQHGRSEATKFDVEKHLGTAVLTDRIVTAVNRCL